MVFLTVRLAVGSAMRFFSVLKNGEEIKSECPECKKEREQEEEKRQKEKAEKKENERIQKNIAFGNIEIDYQNLTFDDYKAETVQQERAAQAVKDIVERKKKKVVLLGETGLGKTMLGSLAVKYMGGKIYRMYDIATMIRQSYSYNAKRTELEIVEELSSLPLLVIDEVGKVGNSEAVIKTTDLELFKRLMKFVSVRASMIASQSHTTKSEIGGEAIVKAAKDELGLSNDVTPNLKDNEYNKEPAPNISDDYEDDGDTDW